MLECDWTPEVLCCYLKGKGLIRKSPQVTVCTADWTVGGNFLLLLILFGLVGFVAFGVFLVVCFLSETCLAISGK